MKPNGVKENPEILTGEEKDQLAKLKNVESEEIEEVLKGMKNEMGENFADAYFYEQEGDMYLKVLKKYKQTIVEARREAFFKLWG